MLSNLWDIWSCMKTFLMCFALIHAGSWQHHPRTHCSYHLTWATYINLCLLYAHMWWTPAFWLSVVLLEVTRTRYLPLVQAMKIRIWPEAADVLASKLLLGLALFSTFQHHHTRTPEVHSLSQLRQRQGSAATTTPVVKCISSRWIQHFKRGSISTKPSVRT